MLKYGINFITQVNFRVFFTAQMTLIKTHKSTMR